MLERAHLPKLNKLSNRIPLMVAKAHKKKMKNKEERMNRCRSGFEVLFIVTCSSNPLLWLFVRRSYVVTILMNSKYSYIQSIIKLAISCDLDYHVDFYSTKA